MAAIAGCHRLASTDAEDVWHLLCDPHNADRYSPLLTLLPMHTGEEDQVQACHPAHCRELGMDQQFCNRSLRSHATCPKKFREQFAVCCIGFNLLAAMLALR